MSPIAELGHAIDAYRSAAEFDIVHDHTVTGPVYATGVPVPNVVTTNHGLFNLELRAIYNAVAHLVPVISLSHHQASTSGRVPVAAVIHHGVDPGLYPVGDGRGGFALFLGRMDPNKGVHTAVEVARAADVPLVIAARMRGPDEVSYFENVVKPLLGGGVEYAGEVERKEKLELLGQAMCLLNPIAWPEPFGMVMVEAMACGTPVVVTPLGAAPEIVVDGETGFLAKDVDALTDAVRRVPTLDRADCRRLVEEHFSAARMAADHAAFYASVTARLRSA
jgi:glycosyltransferase involved in cell wall biosynthesis